MDAAAEPRDGSMQVRDGRTVAWTQWGDPDGRPLLRVPGTPGCRWTVRADRTPWAERGLRVVTTERPGFGASTPLPGRRFREHADDLAEVLDHLGLDRSARPCSPTRWAPSAASWAPPRRRTAR